MTERFDAGADDGPDDLTPEEIAAAVRGDRAMSYEDIVIAGAQALHTLSSFSNVELSIGRCDCTEGCPNVRLIAFRHPLETDQGAEDYQGEAYPVADGRGSDVWEAAIDAHVQLAAAVAKYNERQDEIAYLNSLLED